MIHDRDCDWQVRRSKCSCGLHPKAAASVPPVEVWAQEEYQEGVSAHAAARQLCRSLGCSGQYPTLKFLLEDLLADANRASHEHSQARGALREVLADITKN